MIEFNVNVYLKELSLSLQILVQERLVILRE